MKLKHRPAHIDKTAKEWLLRALIAPAMVVDGLSMILTLSFYSTGFYWKVTDALYRENTIRILAEGKEHSE